MIDRDVLVKFAEFVKQYKQKYGTSNLLLQGALEVAEAGQVKAINRANIVDQKWENDSVKIKEKPPIQIDYLQDETTSTYILMEQTDVGALYVKLDAYQDANNIAKGSLEERFDVLQSQLVEKQKQLQQFVESQFEVIKESVEELHKYICEEEEEAYQALLDNIETNETE